MPQPTGGLLEVTFNQTFGSRAIANIYHYWSPSNTEPISFVALAADFNLKIVAELIKVQSDTIGYVSIRFKTVFGTLPDLVAVPGQADGDLTGDVLNSFTAFSFSLQGTTKETRPGAKRYVGITESNIAGNVVTAGFLALMTTFAPQLVLSLDSGSTLYEPVIYSPFTNTRATPLVNEIISATPSSIITSQVSRKR